MSQAVLCPACGAKVRAGRERCPRCREKLAAVQPAAIAAAAVRSSRRLIWAACGITAVFALTAAALWFTQPARADLSERGVPVQTTVTPSRKPAPAARPQDPVAAYVLPDKAGNVAYDLGDLPTALQRYQEAVRRNPNDAESHSNLGQVLVKMGRPADAVPHYERAIAIIPNRWAYHFNLARALGKLNDWERSVAEYRAAQELFPDDYVTAFNLGLALHKLGDEAAAVEAFKKAIQGEPNDPTFYLSLGMSYDRLQRPTDAAAAYGRYLELAPAAANAAQVKARIAQLTSQASPTEGSASR